MTPRVIVVGAGAIGCALADELTRRSAAVTIIDAAVPLSGASAATFAWVNAYDKSPTTYRDLNLRGIDAHSRRSQRMQDDIRWFHQTGTLQLARTDTDFAALHEQIKRHQEWGIAVRPLTRTDVMNIEPRLSSTATLGGALFPDEGWIDVETMCNHFLGRAQAAGAAFHPFQTVIDIDIRNATVTTRSTDGDVHRHEGDVVVLAAGNGTRDILAAAEIELPITDPGAKDSLGIICTTGSVPRGITHVLRASGIALRPSRNAGITLTDHPTGAVWDVDDPQIWTVPGLLMQRARSLYPFLRDVSIESISLGRRVLPNDGLTIADWVGRDSSVYAVATHSGITLSSYLAEAVTSEILLGTRDHSLREFGMDRFAP
ncbi:NAD(P)/FAD-dependent oxidoreductase [Microbacterium azadirachtae]|uniref:Glycine/D-amino acid oxidase n=1 Tax=Microbacterium azadirachtae TaxID=582680 RepID=A0A1I6G5V4_9MICO|nr:FAD-binding oxidoreductase [Microbacterium azadirachtae]SDL35079.1 Glycine/D-amino acid oxidase [Microbacterium azadirachtae]SEF65718.1 Glycine/D-amino acid oxidase [Microbacterium azadirachtae]SEF66517.1 Glycine/D-amino acid oxidase [Microbacterium azadirachtae]SFR37559.1 Glycine/D-amino acid oxidase [Microbacterium azadirachtae]